jgi:hypothetical protein
MQTPDLNNTGTSDASIPRQRRGRRKLLLLWLRFDWVVYAGIAGVLAIVFGGETTLSWRAAIIAFLGFVISALVCVPLNRWLKARIVE